MNVVTVSFNPAIDQTVCVDNFNVNRVNRGSTMRFEPGGKGVNVAIFLSDYARLGNAKTSITVTGLLGRENAAVFEELFIRRSIRDRFVRIPGQTRVGVKIVDEAQQQTTDINLPGLSPSPEAVDLVYRTVLGLVEDNEWFVLTGSLPPGLPAVTYARLISGLKDQGRKVVLDSSGPPLLEGLKAGPTIAKPNMNELEECAGHPLTDLSSVASAAKQILDYGIQMVVVSMGKQGALLVTPEISLRAVPPDIKVKTTVGAGDAMVAGLVCAQSMGLGLIESARMATAFSVSLITQEKRGLPDLEQIEQFSSQVAVRVLE